jgi:hypothetical protein
MKRSIHKVIRWKTIYNHGLKKPTQNETFVEYRKEKPSGEAAKRAWAERFTAIQVRIRRGFSVQINSSPLQSSNQLLTYVLNTSLVRVPVESSTG